MPIKAILFDKDGTLLDFDATYASATKSVIDDLAASHSVPKAALSEAMGYIPSSNSFRDDAVVIAGSVGDIADAVGSITKPMPLTSLAEEIDALYRQHTRQTLCAFPFTHETLQRLGKMGLLLGVATNDAEGTAREHMELLGLTAAFHSISGYDSGHGAKPAGGMVEAFIKSTSVLAAEVMMVGDSNHDCVAGKAAGAIAVGVTSGQYGQDTLAGVADHVLPDISHLPDLILRLNGETQ